MEANSKKKRKRYSGSDISFNIVNYLIFGLFTLICVYPFYYLIINTISANDLSANGAINFLPKGFHLENYKQVLQLSGLGTLWSRRSDRMYAGMLIRQPDIRRLRILTDFSMS